LYQGVLV